MLRISRTACVVVVLVQLAACGPMPQEQSAKPAGPETRWLRGLAATEVRNAAASRALACGAPEREGGTSVWTCSAATPLVTYRVRWYGSAPLKIEYITATVTQVGPAKADLVEPLFVSLAGLHFEGSDAPAARQWVVTAVGAGGGNTAFGPAKFRVRGDLGTMTLDIKASGSEW
jgi:hypothetical protein